MALSIPYLIPSMIFLYLFSYFWYLKVDTPLRLYLAQITKPSPDQAVVELMTEQQEPPPFTCMVSIRPTVSRVVSCYNYRFGGDDAINRKADWGKTTRGFRPLSEWTADDLSHELQHSYSMYKEGCNNELVRVFGNVAEERVVNSWQMEENDEMDDAWGDNEEESDEEFDENRTRRRQRGQYANEYGRGRPYQQ